jgi:hypothetical protein
MDMTERKPHPSGRPIRQPRWGIKSIPRIPDRGPVTPGLQQKDGAYAVGFTARICVEDDD